MHNLSWMSIISELAMHTLAIFNICTNNENIVQIYEIYGALQHISELEKLLRILQWFTWG